MSGEYYFLELFGPGAAIFDYDNDGDLDVYLVQGGMLGRGKTPADAVFPPPGSAGGGAGSLSDRLFRNDLDPSDGPATLRFTDVTEEAGLDARGYGMGAAVGDYDGDGRGDLYVTNYGPNQLWHNNGDGTFSDVTAATGTSVEGWSVPAVFLDYDRDGRLDLFVGNYVQFDTERSPICPDLTGAPDYCGPNRFRSEGDRLFRNLGPGTDGRVTFADVTEAAGLGESLAPALGALAADLDGDGWPDLYVANDDQANFLWINQGAGSDGRVTFREEGLVAGCSLNEDGEAEASMGVDAGDFDGDGDLDLFMTHLSKESNTLYLNDGTGLFDDYTIEAGLHAPSLAFTSFGSAWFDYDNDGWLDLFMANGAIAKIPALVEAGDPFPVHQPNQLFRNLAGRFEEVTGRAGEVFALSEVSRGTAFGDLDNDGDVDLLVMNNSGPVRLLVNQVGQERRWLGLRLVRGEPPRDVPGARAAVRRPGGAELWRRVRIDGSYASSNDPRLLFGLGDDPEIDAVVVDWGDGSRETWTDLEIDRYTTLRAGEGRPVEP